MLRDPLTRFAADIVGQMFPPERNGRERVPNRCCARSAAPA